MTFDPPASSRPTERTELPVLPPEEAGRRDFLVRMSLGLSGAIALMAATPVVGFILGPFLRAAPGLWRPVGKLEEFPLGDTIRVVFEDPSPLPWAGVTARSAAWLRRTGAQEFIAFSVNCRHLGCPVRWVPGPELFMCPCHGGVYYKDGTVAAGPPPEPLARYPVRVRDGVVEIHAGALPLTIA